MDPRSSSERLAEVMERARRQWQAQRKGEATPGLPPVRPPAAFTIALSREAGANGSLVARAIGERLGWPVYDRELVQHIAADRGLRTGLLKSLDEKHRSWLREYLEAFASASAVCDSAYARHLLETLLSLAAHDACVIVGRGAAQVLPTAVTLRVRLVGPVEDRVKSVCQKFGIPDEEAKRWVERTDGERVRFVKDHFQKDATDPRGYDLVLNSSRLSVPECADLIIEALRRLQARGEAGRGNPGPKPPPMALLPEVPLSDSGQPGGNPGRVDVTGIMPEGICIDPDITEGHPGYEESGDSEIIPAERLAGGGNRRGRGRSGLRSGLALTRRPSRRRAQAKAGEPHQGRPPVLRGTPGP
jgi:cytidylate kinase